MDKDQELMDDFFATHSYDGEPVDWTQFPELGEEVEEEDNVLADEALSPDMRAFAELTGGEWREVDGQRVCVMVEHKEVKR